ncbi:hypothetical protein OB960_10935 [Halobacteria archaeon AArc-xg1-1]|uniref:Uncharacterized protein n=1 Tax=Natronoglomus mannanivorans TaxID=2979990 RepID=A0AAP2YYK5_9EURY|nr:hypothetical protein [Halobacteria archaeon AArc-xg1-1]
MTFYDEKLNVSDIGLRDYEGGPHEDTGGSKRETSEPRHDLEVVERSDER